VSSSDYPSEDERAALWREQTLNRARFQAQLWLDLMAPPEPRQAVMDAWAPVIWWLVERRLGPTNPEDDI